MQYSLNLLLGLSLAAVLIVLLTGVAVFVRGGETNKKWSTKLMSLRVATQAVALVTVALLLFLKTR
ncbi:MAG TPA: HIG1 domain-containing protein [Magnetospirillaceae bacterium]|jgi:hypothetical protein|nr:HIG1 domain-containing protein [Magnetospirillaceae bacterium]